MATVSGQFSKSINNGYQQVIVKWSATTIDEENKSNVSVDTYFKTVGSVSIGSRTNSTTIDGVSQSWNSSSLSGSAKTWKIGSVSKLVEHDNDTGKKTLSISSVFNIQATISGTYYSNITASKSDIELPTIARASTITVEPANIGSTSIITIDKKNTNYTTTLKYKAPNDSTWQPIVEKTTNQSYAWTVPTRLYAMIPNTKTITCQFQATTYNGNTPIGDPKTATATFTATITPTISVATATDTNSKTAQLTSGTNTSTTKMVKSISNVQIYVETEPQGSATISSIKVNGNTMTIGNKSGSNTIKTGTYTINNANTNTFTIEITDSRENKKTINVGDSSITTTNTLTMVNYVILSLNASVRRNTATDGNIIISYNGNYFNSTFGNQSNTLTLEYRYKASTSSTWGNWIALGSGDRTITNNTYSGSKTLSGFDYQSMYNVEVRAKDKIYTNDEKTATNLIVTKGTPVYWWDNDEFNVNGTFGVGGATNLHGLTNNGSLTNKGGVELYGSTPYIDFHYNNSTGDNTSRIIEESSGQLRFTSNVNAKTIQNMYACSGTGNSSSTYVRLCNITFNAHTQGEFVGMKIYIGKGNNGTADQQAFVDLSMQLGWTGSNDGRLGCTWELHPMKTTFDLSNVNIIVIANSRTNYDIYLWTSVAYCKPYYIVNCSNSVTVTNYGTTSTTAPSGTQCYIDKVLSSFNTTTGTGVVTRSSGATLVSSSYARFGNVVQLFLECNTTSSTNAGSNCFAGTISNTSLRPKTYGGGTSYSASSGLIGYIDSSGNITVRVIGANLATSRPFTMVFTYIV